MDTMVGGASICIRSMGVAAIVGTRMRWPIGSMETISHWPMDGLVA